MASTAAEVGVKSKAASGRPPGSAKRWLAIAFLGPALILLGAIVIYPTIDTVAQSFQTSDTRQWIGLGHYQEMIDNDRIVTAIKNNAIWVLTAPAIITGLGLVFAILTERVRYATAIKIVLFMPMAISFLSTGVIWRGVMYEKSPDLGTVNAALKVPANAVDAPGAYPTATVVPAAPVTKEGGAVVAKGEFAAGETALLPLVGMTEEQVPQDAVQAAEPDLGEGAVGAVVWRDFK
ncbi:MAG: carbohydrate ABC transporter permease, partial [Actinomycetota bacterium]